jgi:hypothetical protein
VHGIGELGAINADLPGKQAVRFEFGLAEFGDGGFVAAGQSFKGETAVFVEKEELMAAFGGSECFIRAERIIDVLEKNGRMSCGRVSIARLTTRRLALLPQDRASDGHREIASARENQSRNLRDIEAAFTSLVRAEACCASGYR